MEGFEVPIHRSLTQVIMIAGAPRAVTILNGTLTAALVLGFHSMWGLPIGGLLHFGSVALAKEDPHFLETFRRQIKQKRYYDA